jgi:hypothetical protein
MRTSERDTWEMTSALASGLFPCVSWGLRPVFNVRKFESGSAKSGDGSKEDGSRDCHGKIEREQPEVDRDVEWDSFKTARNHAQE